VSKPRPASKPRTRIVKRCVTKTVRVKGKTRKVKRCKKVRVKVKVKAKAKR